ncbi:hypothetical protein BDV96DRAFT_653925 [Lophiotrema nucula]|uniref:Rhodopsin domain-containing protein n=1 Tax=Lophiotrema nucula TaxID=690887 RepID=A0A6A5YKU0_9PLEO|nr:hypothetical protein BDV96DRAFT_653925 [Lophiotrema nucula]
MPPREYANVALRTLWVSLFFLVTSLYTVKLSILLFYHHLFAIKYAFRIAVYVMITMISLWWLSAFILIFLNTDPIESAWKNAARAKHRFNFNNWYLSYSALSIFFDVTILCFPIPMIKSLHINTRKKLSILGIFWLGAFVCLSAIIRFVFVYKSIFKLKNLGQNNYSLITVAFIWAEVEPSTAVIAACLPTYGPLFPDKGFLTPMAQTIKSFLHIPTTPKAPNSGRPNKFSTTNGSVGYYELDKTLSSKMSAGDIFEIQDKKPMGVGTQIGTDVEAQTDNASDMGGTNSRHGIPRAWIPPQWDDTRV